MITGINAICCLTIIPVRANHDDASEIVTQLLFGETVTTIGIHNQWIKVRISHDSYEGWVDNKQLLKISKETFENFAEIKNRQQENILTLKTPWGEQRILQGSPVLSSKKSFNIDLNEFTWTEKNPTESIKDAVKLALSYSNVPYLWGGRTLFGIDCSGFTQTIYHQLGVQLPRDASQQNLEGKKVAYNQQKSGDLAFFKSETTGNIHHVGIVLPDQQIIHAHGRIRIDSLNQTGIFNENKSYYSHKLISINNYGI
jgi:cell wall-associated NlpC family hydrolase